MTTFSKRHYEELADLVAEIDRTRDKVSAEGVAFRLAALFELDNDRFEVQRFLERALPTTTARRRHIG